MDRGVTDRIATELCDTNGWATPRFIAAGNSAAVYEIDHPDHGPAALKIYDPAFFVGENALIEAKRVSLQEELSGHGHPYLVEVIEARELKDRGTWYLLMEYIDWPTLEEVLEEVPDELVHQLIRQLAEVVLFLEGRNLIHRDIKPSNIAISPDFSKIKLLDLGVVRSISLGEGNGTDDEEKSRFVATAQYSPPEYLTRDEIAGPAGFSAINIYQVGAILHDMIMKKPIFLEEAGTRNKYILYRAVTSKTPRVRSATLPARMVSICVSALQKDPTQRAASVQLQDFIADVDDTESLRRRLTLVAVVPAANPVAPSLLVWGPQVRSWIRAAAIRERETLGAFTMPERQLVGGLRWSVQFQPAYRVVTIDLVQTPAGSLAVEIVSGLADGKLVAFEIMSDGSGMSTAETVAFLADHLLHAIDGLTAMPSGDG